jgi:DNA polymerase elongation subunit (family B)
MKISRIVRIVKKRLIGGRSRMTKYDPLIYGKNELERIVGIEVQDNEAILFIEQEDGIIAKQMAKNRWWVLLSTPQDGADKLAGGLHYRFGKQFLSKDDWSRCTQALRRKAQDFYTTYDPKESLMIKDGFTYFKGMKHTEPSILSFDIESTGLFHSKDSKVLLISNTFRKLGKITRKLFAYDEYDSQGEMLTAWCNWVMEMDPSIIAGHNIYTFDLPYLQFIADKEGVDLNLGRDRSSLTIARKSSKFRIDGSRDQEYSKVRVYGREIIDTMFLAIRHDIVNKKYESYGLKNIIRQEGLEKSDRVHYDSANIRHNYLVHDEWKKIKDYCIHDSDDSLALYDLCAPASFYLTQSIPKSFQAVVESASGSQINSMMVRSYLQYGHSIPKATPIKSFEGAISFGNPGIYRNAHKIDVASLYPNIILQYKVYDEDKDLNGNFLKIMETFTAERLKNKKLAKETGNKYYDDLQNAQKIIVNSGYGFMGAPGLNFNSPDAAEFITKTGRDILEGAIQWAKFKNYPIANADTDSISYTKLNEEEITKEEQIANLREINLLFPERIKFEDDGYFPTVCILKAKNYILYDGKKIKIKGSALKATTKCPALKEMIGKFITSLIENKDDYQEIYHSYIKEACNVQDIKRWASRKTISDKTLNPERTNEQRIKDTLEGTEYVEGDRIYTYFKDNTTLELVERFDGNYSVDKLLASCYDTSWIFENVLDCELLFKNYKLKKSKESLKELIYGNETGNCHQERSEYAERKNVQSSCPRIG